MKKKAKKMIFEFLQKLYSKNDKNKEAIDLIKNNEKQYQCYDMATKEYTDYNKCDNVLNEFLKHCYTGDIFHDDKDNSYFCVQKQNVIDYFIIKVYHDLNNSRVTKIIKSDDENKVLNKFLCHYENKEEERNV